MAISNPLDGSRAHDVAASSMLLLGEVFTRAEAAQQGVSRQTLRRMCRQGTVRQVLRDVYVDSARPDSLQLRVQAVGKVVPDGSVVCDQTAWWVHGGEVVGPDLRQQVPAVKLFRLAGMERVRRPQVSGGTRTLEPGDVMEVDGVLITTPLRTALDLGRLTWRADALAALDSLMRINGFTTDDLVAELPRFRGARGVVQLRQLVPLADARAESPAESVTRLRLYDGGLPMPELQYEVRDAFGFAVYRLDLAYPELMLAVEYDGAEHHTSEDDRAHDEERRAHLRSLGWTVVVLTAADVYGPDAHAARIVRRVRDRLLATQ